MIYLLDTSVIIEALRNNPGVQSFVKEHSSDSFVTSTICEAEIWEGIYREEGNFEKKRQQFERLLLSLGQSLVFDSKVARVAGAIRSALAIDGELIGDIDVLIAATAINEGASVWTKNIKHFERIKSLQVQKF